MCPLTDLHILESIKSLYGWRIYKADVKAAFLQTGKPNRDINVNRPRESTQRYEEVWLLNTATNGLFNSNAKWQNQSDGLLIKLGLQQSTHTNQFFL